MKDKIALQVFIDCGGYPLMLSPVGMFPDTAVARKFAKFVTHQVSVHSPRDF